MKNRLARLDKILAYISEHPYSTCATIATYFNRRIDLIQSDVRMLYRARLIKCRKPNTSQSKGKALVNLGKEYYMDKL